MDPEKKDTSDSETTSVNEPELEKDIEAAGVTEKDRPEQPTRRSRRLEFDQGEQHVKFRRRWFQLWLPKNPPPPAPKSLDDATLLPMVYASFISVLTYSWINPLMVLGYQRTLQATDLWKLDDAREAGALGAQFDAAWAARVQAAAEWNAQLAAGELHPPLWLRIRWFLVALVHLARFAETRRELERAWREGGGRREPSIAWALNDVFGWTFWTGGIFKVFGDTAQLMGPLLVRAIINFSEARVAAKAAGEPTASIGRGVGMAIGLFCITVTASVCTHQFFWRSMTTGMLARAALISSIYKRGLTLTGKARTTLPNSKLVTHISTDVSRVDACAQWFHAGASHCVTICLIILLVQLGYSALAGFSLFLLLMPIQERVMSFQFSIGKRALKWTDRRSKLILEVLGAMRVVKYFSHEESFLRRIYDMRTNELRGTRKIQIARSANIASAFSVPVLAATLSFVTYTSTSHAFNVATIFSSLALFNLLRQPLMFLPRALSATTDAQNALERLKVLFLAELNEGSTFVVDKEQKMGLLVEDATFEWEEGPSAREGKEEGRKERRRPGDSTPAHEQSAPFQVKDVTMSIPRGTLAAVVGTVGSGKSSLLQGLIGEMRKVRGHVSFGGKVAYCSQTAWIQNASLRENVLFGQPYEEERYWKAIENASLLPDLEVLPDGDLTEIGEKGINLSGGQKQRVNIARALYYNADVIIFDDPLSAVDAHVGKALFADAIVGALRNRGKTVILNGRVEEQGTYSELVKNEKEFSRLIKEFGGTSTKEEEEDIEEQAIEAPRGKPVTTVDETKLREESAKRAAAGTGKLEGRLIVPEKRTTGSVSWKIYGEYLKAGRGWITGPVVLLFIILMQGCTIMNSYTLIWWEEDNWGKGNSFYQILYACLGIGQAFFTFAVGGTMDELGFHVSSNLHHDAIRNIFYAPMSYFDTTPLGRILSIFGKDIENIDNQLPVILTVSNMIGSVTIITVLEHYFIIAVVGIGLGYNYFASFYRASARELKRIDAMLRSILYAHFAESLSGLATIRSYGETARFLKDNEYYVDLEDRAGILTVTNQRWLAIRLDFLGGLLIFVVAMLAVSNVSGINPAQIGLVLTYSTALVQLCSMVTRQSAEVETYMSSVERVVEYSRGDRIEQEAPHEIKDRKPPKEWPDRGAIEFKDVVMRYRPGLPFVLKGLSLSIKGGEKIGVVGSRTGAGKSSLMLALFRIVELSSGSINIDDIDISAIGLKDLRSKLSIIPQDVSTIRSNLDPFNQYTDAHLWDALRRSYLVDNTAKAACEDHDGTETPQSRFTLDTVIESEGANLSVGERSLLSLALLILTLVDSASVDLETDSKIQQTIQTQFGHKTLLCIAHRLRTIISYDRILVMDSGRIAEFDTPLNLFQLENGIFRGMCERSGITTAEIEKAVLKMHML
ncbi:P-loop containing nucleoside triphosphate hydrolase protein [Fomitopsis serialis]|uniref:P-loop containing nucleoside triphosphate hydrolase protein n=1 Tax=Fomitopsis serialis TaxID=139415 RepID=UPI0020074E86|nr:P-loop containing nucleoside triphosphate hydrolase protein [Neoantrodia serialis]KAH9929982.1 P-loop containing nucleoside triphosphate hydrolase protein [Neoantrodia serialis]